MELLKRKIKIIILSGKARSGKDEVADIIIDYFKDKKVKRLSYAYYLKQYVKSIISWDGSEDDKPRDLLQTIGIDLLKNKIDNKLLIRRMLEDIDVYSYFYDIIVITDARLVDEIDDIKNKYNDCYCIRINRNTSNGLTNNQKEHIKETGLDNYNNFDYKIDNNDNYNNLKKNVYKILEEINE